MAEHVDTLIDLLREEHQFYEVMLELSLQKKQVIIAGDIDELDRISAEQSSLLEKIVDHKAERQKTALIYFKENNLPEDLTFSELGSLTPQQKLQIDELLPAFRKTLSEIQSVNEVIAHLLKNHLDYVQKIIDVVSETELVETYKASGQQSVKREQTNKLIDSIL